MKYSLKDFKRAADRHVGGMELSDAGRDRLTRPDRPRPAPMSWAGWSAVAAACLLIAFLFSLPVSPSGQGQDAPLSALHSGSAPESSHEPDAHESLAMATPAPDEQGSPAASAMPNSDVPGIAAHDAQGNPIIPAPDTQGNVSTSAPYASAYPSDAPGYLPEDAAVSPGSGDVLKSSLENYVRADMRFIRYDYMGRAYYIDRPPMQTQHGYSSCADMDYDEDYYTVDEVMATEQGRNYYEGDKPDYYNRSLWPRADRAHYLPAIEGCDWQTYYTELGVGMITRRSDDRWALANADGPITDFDYGYMYQFTASGHAIAEIASDDNTLGRIVVLDAQGQLIDTPYSNLKGQLSQLYVEHDVLNALYGDVQPVSDEQYEPDTDDRLAYYLLETYEKYEYTDDGMVLDAEPGCTYLLATDGSVLIKARQVFTFGSALNALTPYEDADSGLWGYFDIDARPAISPRYVTAYPFSRGLAAVRVDTGERGHLFGFICESGRMAIAPQFVDVDMNGFDSSGHTRVMYGYDDVWHTIDLEGNDITSGMDLFWQRLHLELERIHMNMRTYGLALMALMIALLDLRRAREQQKLGYTRPRCENGFYALAAFAIAYAALDETMQSAYPGLMLKINHSYDVSTYIVLAAMLIVALLCGTMWSWSMKQRMHSRVSRALAMLAPAYLIALRWLLGASTCMDIDIAVAFAIGEALGALPPAYAAEPMPRDFRRFFLPALGILGCALAITVSVWSWNGCGVVTEVRSQQISMADADVLDEYNQLMAELDDSDDDPMAYSEAASDRQFLSQALDSPDEYSVLRYQITVSNRSPRRLYGALVFFDQSEIMQDYDAYQLSRALYDTAIDADTISLAPYESRTVVMSYIVRNADIVCPPEKLIAGFKVL